MALLSVSTSAPKGKGAFVILSFIQDRISEGSPKAARACSVTPITTAPYRYVPYSHVRECVPWIFPLEEAEQGRLPYGASFAMVAAGGAA